MSKKRDQMDASRKDWCEYSNQILKCKMSKIIFPNRTHEKRGEEERKGISFNSLEITYA